MRHSIFLMTPNIGMPIPNGTQTFRTEMNIPVLCCEKEATKWNKKKSAQNRADLRGTWRSRTALNGFADRYLTARTRYPLF